MSSAKKVNRDVDAFLTGLANSDEAAARTALREMGSTRWTVAIWFAQIASQGLEPGSYDVEVDRIGPEASDKGVELAETVAALIIAKANQDDAGFDALWRTLSDDEQVSTCMALAEILEQVVKL